MMDFFVPNRSRMMTTRYKIACASLLVLVFCSGAPSDDKQPGTTGRTAGKKETGAVGKKNSEAVTTKDEDAVSKKNAETVSKALASLAKAYNARDPKAIAALFTPKGEFID